MVIETIGEEEERRWRIICMRKRTCECQAWSRPIVSLMNAIGLAPPQARLSNKKKLPVCRGRGAIGSCAGGTGTRWCGGWGTVWVKCNCNISYNQRCTRRWILIFTHAPLRRQRCPLAPLGVELLFWEFSPAPLWHRFLRCAVAHTYIAHVYIHNAMTVGPIELVWTYTF